MRGALGLVVVCAVVWAFWMSWEWLRNRNKESLNDKTED